RLEEQSLRTEHPWGLAAAQRVQGLLALARNELDDAISALEGAAGAFRALDHPFDVARTELLLGRALRRAGLRRRATDALDAAAAGFAELGAEPWIQRCADERSRTGQRRRDDGDELTHAERHVAELVAGGR